MESIEFNPNEVPFKLRYTSTEKLCKEIIKMIRDRHDSYGKMTDEIEQIDKHKMILTNIKLNLDETYDCLKKIKSQCQCQSDDVENNKLGNRILLLNQDFDRLTIEYPLIYMGIYFSVFYWVNCYFDY